jgi:hypothetical protein
MAFDQAAFEQMLSDYLTDRVSLEIVDYYGDVNPIGAGSQGVNLDVGETHSFDLRIRNTGPIRLLNVIVRLTARHGGISLSFFGLVNVAGAHWLPPFGPSAMVRPFHLDPFQDLLLKHSASGGHLFGYKLQEPTAGTDNNREVETLLTATIESWEPDLGSISAIKGPQALYRNFIQRS